MKKSDELPIDFAIKLKQKGLNNSQIILGLEGGGYNTQQIAESMNQLSIKNSIESGSLSQNSMQPSLIDEDVPVPSPPQEQADMEKPYQPVQQTSFSFQQPAAITNFSSQENTQELIESVVEEKWQRFSDSMADFEIWKSRVNDDLISIKQEVIRLSSRFDIMQKSVLGKVDEYSRNITDVNSEIKALEKVFQNIINPLTSNIKELSRITKDLKER